MIHASVENGPCFVTSLRIPPAAAGEGGSIVDIQGRIEDPRGCGTSGVAMHEPFPSRFCRLPKTRVERPLPEDDADDEEEITFVAESSPIRTNSQQTPGEERGCTCRRESWRRPNVFRIVQSKGSKPATVGSSTNFEVPRELQRQRVLRQG